MSRTLLGGLCALALLSCTAKPAEEPKAPVKSTPIAAPAPVAEEPMPPLMTSEEAAAKAAKSISQQNADAELEKLKKELAGGE